MEKLTLGVLGVIILYKGYYYGKNYLEKYVMDKVMSELDKRIKDEEDEELFKPMHKNSAIIKVKHGGKSHSVYIPYNRRKSSIMLRRKVFLIRDNEKIEISQKPGIPYLVSAEDLGGEKIQIEDLEGNIVSTFEKGEIPSF